MAFGDFTVARTSVKYVLNASGVLASVAANTPAFEFNTDGTYRGLLVEPAATNLALQSRDLTQAVWTATNATTSRTATGVDGTANTGTIVTATAGNATILQAITSASSARVFGARVRRRTGTGTVEITQDNGSTWTAITLTSTYQLFATASQTLTNPTAGFRIVASGDAIDVDFCQAETGAVATSPIPTAASTETRTADSVTLAGASSLIGQTEGTLYVEHQPILSTGLASRQVIAVSDNTFDNNVRLVYQAFGSPFRYRLVSTVRQGASNLYEFTEGNAGGLTTGNVEKIAIAYKDADYATYRNGVAVVGTVTGTGALTSIASSEIDLGQAEDNSLQLNGWIRAVALYPTRLSNAQLAVLTTL
jgi:hypothetical protein